MKSIYPDQYYIEWEVLYQLHRARVKAICARLPNDSDRDARRDEIFRSGEILSSQTADLTMKYQGKMVEIEDEDDNSDECVRGTGGSGDSDVDLRSGGSSQELEETNCFGGISPYIRGDEARLPAETSDTGAEDSLVSLNIRSSQTESKAAGVDTSLGVKMSAVVEFFHGAKDNRGRTIDAILGASDAALEASHDFVQWIFPLHEKSLHSINTPVLTVDDIKALRESPMAQENVLRCLARFRIFLGIEPKDAKKQAMWANNGNHNLLRVTRIIRSLRLFGLESDAQAFYDQVAEIAEARKINKITCEFWAKAMNEQVGESLTSDFLKIKRIDL